MAAESLFGFIGEVHGNESHLVAMDAVSVRDGEYIRYPVSGELDPRPLKTGDLAYVTPIDEAAELEWSQGDIIWFAGRHLVARSTMEATHGFSSDWTATTAGYRLRSGTAVQFRRWRNITADKLSEKFRRYISDHWEIRAGEAQMAWELYAAFDSSASPRRSINAGLYFFEIEKNLQRFDAERKRAVRNGAFETVELFDAEFKRTREFLRAERLADVTAPSTDVETPRTERSSGVSHTDMLAHLFIHGVDTPAATSTLRWWKRTRGRPSDLTFTSGLQIQWIEVKQQALTSTDSTQDLVDEILAKYPDLISGIMLDAHGRHGSESGTAGGTSEAPSTFVINEQLEKQ